MLRKNIPGNILEKIFLCIYALFVLIPLYSIVVTAFKTPAEITLSPLGLPAKLVFNNFALAFEKAKILDYTFNSFYTLLVSLVLILLLNLACAYGIYKSFGKRLGKFFYAVIMSGMMIAPVGYVTTILLYRQFHLYNSLNGVVVAFTAGSVPMGIFLLVGFMRSIPRELEEASTMDGCNDLENLVYIVIPLLKPAIATVAVFNIVGCWNNMFTPLILLRNPKLYTIQIGLLNLRGSYNIEYNLLFAAMLITAVPVILIYFAFQNRFVESLAGSVKG